MSNDSNLERIAFVDNLTGLKNKNSFLDSFQEKSLKNQHFILVDIDDFKKMNTIFGIDAVDQMLISISGTLKDYCGKSDVYRIGAGQFLLVTESHIMCEPTELKRILIQPVVLDDLQVVVNASICVLDHDDFPETKIDRILKLLTLTIELAKKNGKNQLIYADNSTEESFIERKSIVFNLVNGVENKEFFPKFQPFMDTYTNEIVGYEAVSRWNLDGKEFRPGHFLEAAEWTGLIYDIELQIFEEAIKFFRELKNNKQLKLSKRFKAAVHFSAYTLKRVEITELINILKKYNISQKDVIIETQEKFITDVEAFNKIIEFRKHRFMVLLDEYSNNNASLSFLADLKVDAIKLSETLLDKIDNDQEYLKMMHVYKFLVDISKKFNISVVSDGINSAQNAKLVKDLEVHIGLGKYYSCAIPKNEFIEFIKNNKKKR